jgi:hypothetical protein
MPTISMFYGIIVYMFYHDTGKHSLPHIHVEYQDSNAVVSLPDGTLLDGALPRKQMKILEAWMLLHEDELMADWKLAVQGETIFKIEPLR